MSRCGLQVIDLDRLLEPRQDGALSKLVLSSSGVCRLGQALYVADTGAAHIQDGPRHIRRFAVGGDGRTLSGGEIFATCHAGLFDGFRLDALGNLWTSAGDGVHCYGPDGTMLGKICVPEVVANVCFGGPKRNRLFICATTSLYAIYLATQGCRRP
jgi:gluconolactonase